MIDDKETFSNNNTKKGIGYDYQKLVALEYCINSRKNESIFLECFGDVANGNESLEIKHHFEKHNLSSNSTDVWNTIKNYSIEFDKLIDNDKLILFTTSYIKEDSIFYKWNEKTKGQKYSILDKHKPAEGTFKYKEEFFKLKKENALKVLDKFTIESEQPNIIEKIKCLKENAFFAMIISDELKAAALESAYGYISMKALDNLERWEINSNDFKRDMSFRLKDYFHNNTPFPIIDKKDVDEKELNQRNYLFIEKIQKIGLKENDQANAVEDYIKANLSAEKLLSINPIIAENLKIYDRDIERLLKDEKSSNSYNLTKNDLNTNKSFSESRIVFFKSINKEHQPIIDVTNTQRYYRNGRIHDIIENNLFDWEFKENDL